MGSGRFDIEAVGGATRKIPSQARRDVAIAGDLPDEIQYPEISRLFGVAHSLHDNFYENQMRDRIVEYGIRDVERFVEKVESLL